MKDSINPSGHIKMPEKMSGSSEIFQEDSPLLWITVIDDLKIKYLNNMVGIYTGIDVDNLKKEHISFYKNYIHPDDYPDYLVHLISCKDLEQGEEKIIFIRLRDNKGSYTKFCFKDRLYNPTLTTQEKIVLSTAHKIKTNFNPQLKKNPSCQEKFPLKYKQYLDSIDEEYCVVEMINDLTGKPADFLIIETSPFFEEQVNFLGAKGKTMREIAPNHEEYWFKTFGKVAVSGKSVRFQGHAEYLDNSWLDVYAFKLGNKNSRKVVVLFHNISKNKYVDQPFIKIKEELKERAKHRHQEINENTELLQTVFDNTNLAIAVFKTLYDEDGNIKDFLFIRINKVLRELYLDKDPLGKAYGTISLHGVQMGILDAFKKVMETGEALDREFFYDKEGFFNWFRITARRQNNLLIASIEDITSRKAEIQQLEEAVRFKKQLVQTSPDTIVIINLNDFKVRYINKDLLARAGMTKEKILGISLPDILVYVHPRDREKMMDFHKKILKSSDDEILDIEFRVKTKGSNWEWFNARGKIFNRQSEKWVEEYVILIRNITEQKNTQRALVNAEKLSIQGEIARTFAHELRNPLASIRMATDVLKMRLDLPEKEPLETYFNILSRSTKVLNNLVSNLLNSSNYSPAVLDKIDLAEVVNETLKKAADRIYLTGIKVVKNYEGPYFILADKEKLEIAILNIIVNASEATAPDKGIIKITIKTHKTDFMLSISDNGHGLEPDQIERLFDAFYSNKSTGVGIGLTSVKNILQEHDAQISVTSTPQKGTIFNILFHNVEME